MIGTLIGQEFRETRKSLLTTLGISLLVIASSFLVAALRLPVIGDIAFGLGVVVTVLLSPLALALLTASYWRTMYGREGYFTMTLPVRGRTIFWAKVLYAIAVSVVALVLTVLGIVAALAVFAITQGMEASAFLREGLDTLDPGIAWFIGVALVFQMIFFVIAGAALMSIGARGRFNHLGFGAPVIGAVILYFVMQFLSFLAMLFIPFGVRIGGPDAGTFVAEGMFADFVAALEPGDPAAQAQPSVLGLGVVVVAAVAAIVLAWAGARSVDRHTSLR